MAWQVDIAASVASMTCKATWGYGSLWPFGSLNTLSMILASSNNLAVCSDTKQRKNLQDPVVQGAGRPHLPHEPILKVNLKNPLEAWHTNQSNDVPWLTPRHSDATAMHKSDPERMNNPTGVCATLSFLKPKKATGKLPPGTAFFCRRCRLPTVRESGWHS